MVGASLAIETLHADIVAATGLDLDSVPEVSSGPASANYPAGKRPARDPAFREKVLRAYEFRCCICGFDLRIGHLPAGLEAAHIQWHHVGGPDIETNGLALCALHHKLFDLGVFTIDARERRVIFSQHAIGGGRGLAGELAHHGQLMHAPQDEIFSPDRQFLEWNRANVFKAPGRR
jgi:putative restriction endonuclease